VDENLSINNSKNKDKSEQIIVRINGELPDITSVLESNSERAKEITEMISPANTSCSIISSNSNRPNKPFHLLIDSGHGVVRSLENIPKSGLISLHPHSYVPHALLLTHSHEDHIHDIGSLLNYFDNTNKLQIFCTSQTREQVIEKLDHHMLDSKAKFVEIWSGRAIKIGPFTVMPLSVNHYDANYADKETNKDMAASVLSGCVMFVVELQNKKKIVIGWDFLRINDFEQNLLWNPELVILGTETYNPHPTTGMISVTEAYDFVRTWNAKECFLVHYSGSMDHEDAKNQWFRGPTKAMTSTQLQGTINDQLKLNGNDGKFKITVAHAGQTWSTTLNKSGETMIENETSVGRSVEIESLQNYILRLEKGNEDQNRLYLTLEDRINRYSLEFVNPHLDKNNADILHGDPVKGMMAKGPQLEMQIIPHSSSDLPDSSQISMNIVRGKKQIFKDDILIKSIDLKKLRRFTRENFA
jgi:phosphoribosyl 1,2-cyclic phosphodiesterase